MLAYYAYCVKIKFVTQLVLIFIRVGNLWSLFVLVLQIVRNGTTYAMLIKDCILVCFFLSWRDSFPTTFILSEIDINLVIVGPL